MDTFSYTEVTALLICMCVQLFVALCRVFGINIFCGVCFWGICESALSEKMHNIGLGAVVQRRYGDNSRRGGASSRKLQTWQRAVKILTLLSPRGLLLEGARRRPLQGRVPRRLPARGSCEVRPVPCELPAGVTGLRS